MPKALLFDLDGTLANSEPLKGRAIALACQALGGQVDAEIYAEVMGADWPTVTGHFFRHAGIQPEMSDFSPLFRGFYQQLLQDEVQLTAGALPLLQTAREQGMHLAVVSSAARWMIDAVLARCGVAEVFDLVISNEDVSEHKPHPAAYLLALEKLGLQSTDVLIFEDSEAGLAAATAAGCRCIAVRHAFNARHDFAAASACVDDFHAVLSLITTQHSYN